MLSIAVSEATTYRQVNDLVPGWLVILKVHDVWVIPAPAIPHKSSANCAALDQPSSPQLIDMLQVRLEEIREAVTDPESVNVQNPRRSGVQHDVQCQQQSILTDCELCLLPKEETGAGSDLRSGFSLSASARGPKLALWRPPACHVGMSCLSMPVMCSLLEDPLSPDCTITKGAWAMPLHGAVCDEEQLWAPSCF